MSAANAQDSSRRTWLKVLVVLAVLVAAVVVIRALLPKQTIPVRAVKVERGMVRDVVSSSQAGEVTAELHAAVRAEVGGAVVAVLHKRGERVTKGTVIVRLDPADLQARANQAEAAAAAAQGQVAQAQARLITLQRQAARAQLLLLKGAGTASISEDAASAVNEATQGFKAAEGTLRQTQAAAKVAQIARSRSDILAPFDGLLTDVYPNLGEALAPSAPVFQIIDDQGLHVDTPIDEADAAKVRVGQEATLKLDALPGRPIKGRVRLVDPAVKRDLKGARTLAVEVEVVDVKGAREVGLKPGMSANVDIITAEKPDVLNLPSNAIIGRGVQRAVYRLVPEGKHHRAVRTNVGVGLENWERTEILSGLALDDLVVATLNVKGLDDGALVRLTAEGAGR